MNNINRFPFKQVHLDFHTSPDIPGIGESFSKENFQKALKKGNLDSITIFAKCHHGLCYYPTDVGTMHPNLTFDLTGAMIDAAHEIGVRAPVYITAGWSHKDAIDHPEWVSVDRDGKYQTTGAYDLNASYNHPKKGCAWHMLCLNDGGYANHIYELTEEICKRYKVVDGLFYDICFSGDPCYCDSCRKGMCDMGLDPDNENDAKKYFVIKHQAFMKKCGDIMRKYHKDATIFFNGGGAHPQKYQYHDFQTHFEMEDLPTIWGGYDKLPLRAKFFANKGKPVLGMTGKFHLAWGEFGGFKTKEALKFELATMALYGAGASVGDHMHPDGKMEMQTYENIGYAYDYLEKIAPFCYGGESVANLGLYLSKKWDVNEGISKILLENQIDYGVVSNSNFEMFDTVIIPDCAQPDDDEIEAFKAYINNGGKGIIMSDALVRDGKFLVDTGLDYVGAAEFDCDYIVPCDAQDDLPDAPTLSYIPGHRTENVDAEIFAEIITPYFSRTYGHFCGHKNTPHNKASKKMPAIAKKGNIVYLAHSLPAEYNEFGCVFHKRYFMYALNLVYGGSPLKISGLGAQGRCTMINQTELGRYCINIMYASPVKRGVAEIIEDIVPLYDLNVSVKTDKKIKDVYFGVTSEKIDFVQTGDEVTFMIPKLECHTSVVMEY